MLITNFNNFNFIAFVATISESEESGQQAGENGRCFDETGFRERPGKNRVPRQDPREQDPATWKRIHWSHQLQSGPGTIFC